MCQYFASPCVAKSFLVSLSILNGYSDFEALVKERLPSQAVKACGAEFASPRVCSFPLVSRLPCHTKLNLKANL